MKALVTGGCKNGKSSLAQRIAVSQGQRRLYVATMVPRDAEDFACVRRHREDRAGMGFDTLECPRGVESLIGLAPPDASLLVDSVTALLAEEMFQRGSFDADAPARVCEGLEKVCDAFENVVFVSDSIGSDACIYDAMTESYRAGLAAAERTLAQKCDVVLEQRFGCSVVFKGKERMAACPLPPRAQSVRKEPHMVLIVGGAHQGKRAFAEEKLGIAPECILEHAEMRVREMLEAGQDPLAQMPELAEKWRDGAILLDDVCCGVVPVEASERAWRVAVGRCGTFLAARAERVYRVCCGLGEELYHA